MSDGRIEAPQFCVHSLLLDCSQVEECLDQHRHSLLLQNGHSRVCFPLESGLRPDLLVDILLFICLPLLFELSDFVFGDYLTIFYICTSDLSNRML
jgi:hypothetical protein